MRSEAVRYSLLGAACALLALFLLAGTFFAGMRIGTYRAARRAQEVLRQGGEVTVPAGLAGGAEDGALSRGFVAVLTPEGFTLVSPRGETRKVVLTPTTMIGPQGAAELREGDVVFVLGSKGEGGALEARRIRVTGKRPK